jgi:hypothetical protein
MPRNGQQDVPLVVGLFLMVLAMMSVGNLGLSIANSRDIYKINAKINAIINNDSHVMIAEVTKRGPSDESAVFAREKEDTSLELSPHPFYGNVLMSKMIYPNTTSSKVLKRYRPSQWGLGMSKLANTDGVIRGLAYDCRTWTEIDEVGDLRKLGCVYGAISTPIAMGGADHATYAYGARTARMLKIWYSAEQKRSEPGHSGTIDSTLLEYQNFMVNISQSPMTLMFDESANLITYNETGLPIMFGLNGKGDGMLVTYQPNPGNVSEATAIYGFVPPLPASQDEKTVCFNEENFVQGGLEALYSFNQSSDGGWLSTQRDFGGMNHEVSHLLGDLAGSGYAWQIQDNDHNGTSVRGTIKSLQSARDKGQDLDSEIRT